MKMRLDKKQQHLIFIEYDQYYVVIFFNFNLQMFILYSISIICERERINYSLKNSPKTLFFT